MKIVVPSMGPAVDERTVGYVIDIAKRLSAQLIVLHILSENEADAIGKKRIKRFVDMGAESNLSVTALIRPGDVVTGILDVACEHAADLILMGVSHGEIVAEWMTARAMDRTDIPVLLIPKWVPAPIKPSSKDGRQDGR